MLRDDILLRVSQSQLILDQAFKDGRMTFDQYDRACQRLTDVVNATSITDSSQGEL